MMRTVLTWVFIASSLLLVGGCSFIKSFTEREDSTITEDVVYQEALDQLNDNQFILAVETLQRLESDFPFGKYAYSAQLALIYAHFETDEEELADAAASRFIRLHPNHPNVDYAWYMRGRATFPKPSSAFQSMFNTDLSKRDTKQAQTAYVHFSELVRRYPNSQYAPDAIKRMEYLRNLLARYEINIANYYMSRDAWLAAANRARYVIENFQQSPSMPDALAILIQSYHQLGMAELEASSLAVLRQNFPDYPALTESGFNYDYYVKDSTSLIGLTTFGLIDTSKPPGFDTRSQYGRY